MPYAFVEDIAASWEHYAAFAAALEDPLPEGLLLHAAGPTDEGFRIIGVWESEEAWDRFRAERLGFEAEAAGEVRPTFSALRPVHVVRGSVRERSGPPGGRPRPPSDRQPEEVGNAQDIHRDGRGPSSQRCSRRPPPRRPDAACGICGKNLIKNPGADLGAGITAVDAFGAVPGLDERSGTVRRRLVHVPERLVLEDRRARRTRGKNYFFGGTTPCGSRGAGDDRQADDQASGSRAGSQGDAQRLARQLREELRAGAGRQFADASGSRARRGQIGPDTTISGTDMQARSRSMKCPPAPTRSRSSCRSAAATRPTSSPAPTSSHSSSRSTMGRRSANAPSPAHARVRAWRRSPVPSTIGAAGEMKRRATARGIMLAASIAAATAFAAAVAAGVEAMPEGGIFRIASPSRPVSTISTRRSRSPHLPGLSSTPRARDS